jgi:predicted O-methyltransferase YrrM
MIREQARRLLFGLATLFGIKKRGFFIPYRYAGQVPDREGRGEYWALTPLFAAAEPDFLALLARMDAYGEGLAAVGDGPAPAPRWNQDWFPRLDGAAAYVLVRDRKPRRIVEVGSGHSTRFVARAVYDGELDAEITAIDPQPRAAIEGLGAKILRRTVQDAGTEPFEDLEAGDILFIDSSHILMPGTDVDYLFNHVLPVLPPGVLVHVHDIFLPDDYPAEWSWRAYNVQLGVAALLQGGGYRIVWASQYAASRMADAVDASAAGTLPLLPGAFESSLWLEKL